MVQTKVYYKRAEYKFHDKEAMLQGNTVDKFIDGIVTHNSDEICIFWWSLLIVKSLNHAILMKVSFGPSK